MSHPDSQPPLSDSVDMPVDVPVSQQVEQYFMTFCQQVEGLAQGIQQGVLTVQDYDRLLNLLLSLRPKTCKNPNAGEALTMLGNLYNVSKDDAGRLLPDRVSKTFTLYHRSLKLLCQACLAAVALPVLAVNYSMCRQLLQNAMRALAVDDLLITTAAVPNMAALHDDSILNGQQDGRELAAELLRAYDSQRRQQDVDAIARSGEHTHDLPMARTVLLLGTASWLNSPAEPIMLWLAAENGNNNLFTTTPSPLTWWWATAATEKFYSNRNLTAPERARLKKAYAAFANAAAEYAATIAPESPVHSLLCDFVSDLSQPHLAALPEVAAATGLLRKTLGLTDSAGEKTTVITSAEIWQTMKNTPAFPDACLTAVQFFLYRQFYEAQQKKPNQRWKLPAIPLDSTITDARTRRRAGLMVFVEEFLWLNKIGGYGVIGSPQMRAEIRAELENFITTGALAQLRQAGSDILLAPPPSRTLG